MSVNRLIWFNGKLVQADLAKVSVLSPTAQFGLNVFEGIRGYWNINKEELYLFRLDEHLDRLFASCKIIGLSCPFTKAEICDIIKMTIEANDYREDIALRVTVFVDEEGSWHTSEPVNMFVAPIAKPRSVTENLAGKKACISTWRRIDDLTLPPRIKAGANYINGRYAQIEATGKGFDLPVFLNQKGQISEGAGACIFAVSKGILITPDTGASILESITRDTLIELARKQGIPVEERGIDRTELYLADEIFLCGSAAEITPVVKLDTHQIGLGEVGTVTKTLLDLYLASASNEMATGKDWISAVYNRTIIR